MIRIPNEAELLETFRPSERDEVRLSPDFRFPLPLKDCLSWTEPSGHRVYLVFQDPSEGYLRGIVFQRTHASTDTPASMCQWCHTVRSGTGVSLLTAAVGPNRRIGMHLCSDLNCKENTLSPPGIHDLRESLSSYERLQRVLKRMGEFASRNLF